MIVYVTSGGMLATTWVQIIKAVLLLSGATFMALAVLWHFGFSLEAMFGKGRSKSIPSIWRSWSPAPSCPTPSRRYPWGWR